MLTIYILYLKITIKYKIIQCGGCVLWLKYYFMIDIHMYDYLYYESTSYNLITHMFYKLNF